MLKIVRIWFCFGEDLSWLPTFESWEKNSVFLTPEQFFQMARWTPFA